MTPPSPEELARAFSGHDFERALPHLAPDVEWVHLGAATHEGSDAVAEVCRESAAHLAGVATQFRRFRAIVAEHSVVIDSLAEYREHNGDKTTVAACDIYDFVDGRIAKIVSYTVAV